MRSLSQPTGLDRLAHDTDDVSDTDSISHDHHSTEERSVFAEVLYSFSPGGPEELALQKGDLVEVLKKDSGPWWWGKIKQEQIIASSGHVQDLYGWFPKDFVKVLPVFQKPRLPRHYKRHRHHHHHRRSRSQSDDMGRDVTDDDDDEEEESVAVQLPIAIPVSGCDSVNKIVVGVTSPTRLGEVTTTNGAGGSSGGEHDGGTDESDEPRPSLSSQNSETMRRNAVRELLEAEMNYVKLLESLCVG